MANLCKPAYDYSGMEREHLFTLCMTSQKYFGILCRFNPIKMQQLRNKFDWVSAYYFGSGMQLAKLPSVTETEICKFNV